MPGSSASVFATGGGAMGARLREFDWSATPLGPIARWPDALRVAVDQALNSRFPTCLFWGPEFIMVYNDGYRPMLGGKPEALGRRVQDAWPEVWDELGPVAQRALAGEATYVEDHRLEVMRGGPVEEAFFTFCYSPVFDAAGQVVGVLDIALETTANVRSAQAMRADRERQQHLLDQMPGFAGVMAGPEHRYTYVNDAYRKLSGGRDFLGRTVREVFPEVEGQGYFEMIDGVYAGGRSVQLADTPVTLEGHDGPVWVDLLFEPVRDAQGRVEGVFVGGYDITERKKAEQALLEAQQRLRVMTERALATRTAERDILAHIVEATDAEIQVIGTDHRFLAINRACSIAYQRTFGIQPKVGDRLDDVLAQLPSPKQREIAKDLWRRALGGESFRLEHEWGERGDRRFFEMNFEVLRGPDGTQVGAFLTGNDVTARRRSEEALAAAQDALRQSQKMEAVGQLTGGIAHDFNNLLAAISGSLQVLKAKLARGQHEGLAKYVDIGENSVRRAAALTHRLLAFSRRQALDPRPLDANRLVRGMEDLLRRTVGPNVALRVIEGEGLWPTRADTSQLENSLLNLCINGRDAMQPAGGELTIETKNVHLSGTAQDVRVPEGDYVRISVTDSGVGIPAEDIARIFEPFFTTKPLGQGTGLGLSMVYGFVTQSGGQVQVQSVVGRGTTMHLYLPRTEAQAGDAAKLPPVAVPERGGGETVLLVEDEAPLRGLLAEMLGEAGYHVLAAANGTEALQHLQAAGRIDLMITDVGLPGGLNGRQVADAGRALRPTLKVLFVTGYAEKAAVGGGLVEPGMALMTKPFEMAELARRVKSMVEEG